MRALRYLAAIGLLSATTALAGPTLSLRLVEASNAGGGVDRSLNDVAGALKSQLPFSSYRQLAAGSLPLPAAGHAASLGDYRVTCSGPQQALAITITRGRQNLVTTTVSLRDNRPVLLGGFPSQNGKMIIVFVTR